MCRFPHVDVLSAPLLALSDIEWYICGKARHLISEPRKKNNGYDRVRPIVMSECFSSRTPS
jgi:hypothetical protein